MLFQADPSNKFNPETDEDRPVIGSEITYNDKQYIIKDTRPITTTELMGEENPIIPEGQELICRRHATRLFVMWGIWMELKK